ncbi:MAG: hypothetical protein ACTSQK_08790 [Candidatus Heimdallarchaeota archaeon]
MKSIKKLESTIKVFLVLFVVISLISVNNQSISIHTRATQISHLKNNDLTINGKETIELFVDNKTIQFDTGTYNLNSIININITVLPQSNSSVFIMCSAVYAVEFSPTLTNVTLAPGESFSEDYTIIDRIINGIVYTSRCTTDSNATILWSYDLIYSAKPAGFIGKDLLFISGAFLLSTMTLVLVTKKKSKKKND